MKLITLDEASFAQITDCFNLSFLDYFVPFNVTEGYLRNRWHGASVDLKLSAGVMDKDQLVGFIVNGVRVWNGFKTAFNCGTGVIPTYRGNALTDKMYEFLFPKFHAGEVQSLGLEVIQQNVKAIHIYEKAGLKIRRELNCYNGTVMIDQPNLDEDFYFKKMERPDWGVFKKFNDVEPSWDNNEDSIKQNLKDYIFYGVYKKNEIVAYAIIKPENGYIPQFGVHPNYRNQGVGKFIFAHLAPQFPTLKINNIDASAPHILKFIERVGLVNSINQYEMVSYL